MYPTLGCRHCAAVVEFVQPLGCHLVQNAHSGPHHRVEDADRFQPILERRHTRKAVLTARARVHISDVYVYPCFGAIIPPHDEKFVTGLDHPSMDWIGRRRHIAQSHASIDWDAQIDLRPPVVRSQRATSPLRDSSSQTRS